MESINLTCKHCSKDFEYFYRWKRDRKYCTACFSRMKRQRMKKKAVEFMGGECVACGYKKCLSALQFHHINPTEKDYHFSDTLTSKSWKEVEEELKKCQLVCSNCHAEIHDQQRRKQNDLYQVS